MAHRKAPTTQDPDVEESRGELAQLESKKETVQKETLAIAENKRQLKQDLEDDKRVQDEAHALRKADLERELQRITDDIEAAKQHKENAERDADTAVATRITEENSLTLTKKEHSTLSDSKESLKNETQQLEDKKTSSTTRVASLEESIRKLTLQEADISLAVSKLEEKESNLTSNISTLQSGHETLIDSHIALKADHLKASNSLSDINKDIDTKTQELAAVNDRLQRAKRELLECTQKSDADSARIKSEMGNLALLEQRVEEKHAQLIEAENHFTVEHLARLGYKKLTE